MDVETLALVSHTYIRYTKHIVTTHYAEIKKIQLAQVQVCLCVCVCVRACFIVVDIVGAGLQRGMNEKRLLLSHISYSSTAVTMPVQQ